MVEGYVHPDFGNVTEALMKIPRHRHGGGGAVAVYHHGEKVVDAWTGSRNKAGDPWNEDTIVLSFSTTKGVVSTAIHVLAERGQLAYDEPVATYWPEFAANGKEAVTVEHLLTHSAGLHRVVEIEPDAYRWTDWEHMASAVAAAPPAYPPGTAHGYHGITYAWTAGELVRRASGLPVDEFVAKELAAPLGLDGLYLYVPPSERHRLAQLVPGPLRNRKLAERVVRRIRSLSLTYELGQALIADNVDLLYSTIAGYAAPIPSFNGSFTARSLASLYSVLACDGESGGVRLLSPGRVADIAKIRRTGKDLVVGMDLRWRLGYHLVGTNRGILPNAFGHFGYGGSGAWCDPTRELAVALTCNRVAGTAFGDMRVVQLSGAAVKAADRRDGRRRRA